MTIKLIKILYNSKLTAKFLPKTLDFAIQCDALKVFKKSFDLKQTIMRQSFQGKINF